MLGFDLVALAWVFMCAGVVQYTKYLPKTSAKVSDKSRFHLRIKSCSSAG